MRSCHDGFGSDNVGRNRITNLIRSSGKAVLDVRVRNITGTEETIRATLEHPFAVNSAVDGSESWSWVGASDLTAGMTLADVNGARAVVVSVTPVEQPAAVYNITVDNDHTYFVGDAGIWVHNTSSRNYHESYQPNIQANTSTSAIIFDTGADLKGATLILLSGDVDIVPLIKGERGSFTSFSQNSIQELELNFVINGALFNVDGVASNASYLRGGSVNPSNITNIGEIFEAGLDIGGRPSLGGFFVSEQSNGNGVIYQFGQGNPPLETSLTAFGGAGPLIIGGLPYGQTNSYSGLPSQNLQPAIIGDPGDIYRPFLTQRSSAYISGFVTGYEGDGNFSTGKTILAYNSSKKSLGILIQPDGTKNGISLMGARDALITRGFDNAISFDGSSSSSLISQSGVMIAPSTRKNNAITAGIGFKVGG